MPSLASGLSEMVALGTGEVEVASVVRAVGVTLGLGVEPVAWALWIQVGMFSARAAPLMAAIATDMVIMPRRVCITN